MPGVTQGFHDLLKSPKQKNNSPDSIRSSKRIKKETTKLEPQQEKYEISGNLIDPVKSLMAEERKLERGKEMLNGNDALVKDKCEGIEFVRLNFPTDSGDVPWKKSGHKTLKAGQFERMKLPNYSVEIPCKNPQMFPSISATGTTWWPPQSVT